MNDVMAKIRAAAAEGLLLESTLVNIERALAADSGNLTRESLQELVERSLWAELNDRFFQTLAFGTGGLRGRTIGRHVTTAENGSPTELGRPQFACVGTNAMNPANITRATIGLVTYVREWLQSRGETVTPKIAVAHDTRHFSREFAELTARLAAEQGCDAVLFETARSTPELSFAVRHTGAHAGVVLTASHNPSHDNGYKVYFNDGAQIVEPHASEIIRRVNAVDPSAVQAVPENARGRIVKVGADIDEAYMKRLQSLILDPAMVASQKSRLKIVFTPIHGTGGVIIKQMLERLGFNWTVVGQQDVFDGRFPTVKSPNPENAEALALALQKAEETRADLVMGTDPDSDRLGVAVRTRSGELKLLSGNQLASLIAYYRVTKMFETGWLTPENASQAALVKTIVTTDLLKVIAQKHGLHFVETLTGFKYIGEKLGQYENALPDDVRRSYRGLSEEESRAARLAHSRFYVFGGEESYGYSGADFVRDKDANGSALMFAEVAAYAASRGLTLDELLDEIHATYGFFHEKGASLVFEGAEGAGKIAALAASYAAEPPAEILGTAVSSTVNFATETITDSEGLTLPKEKMLLFNLADGWRVAIRPSGTEPKIKFYLFARQDPPSNGTFSKDELAGIKAGAVQRIEAVWDCLREDAARRVG